MRGTHTGDHHGLPPTGNIVAVSAATFSEYDADGLITSHAGHYVDVPSLLRQLGVGEAREPPEARGSVHTAESFARKQSTGFE